ncbi:Protein ACTIVITY OF BC1 COMPLEX KINASE 3, chloroplastic, partial [Hondaea fermentalgiana]
TFSGDCALLIVLTVDSPVVTKFAQLLSGRVDLIPQAVADRLAFLQSRAPPMSPQEVEAALCRCYGEDRSHLFASFDMRPLAVGTVAQVHRAHLASSGEPVAVKIVKRGMRKGLDRYLFLLRMLSRLGVFGRSKVARLRVEHVTMMFRQQTDLNLEAASMQAMQREAQRHRVRREDRCHVPDFPQAYSLFTMENILVMDLIDDCVSLQDFLAKPSVPVKVMLARVGRIFYRSVMMDGLLHCDMHPGNIMVRPEFGRIVLLDFGLVGELTESERVALVAFHLASVSNEFVFAAEIFVENFVADVDGRLSDEDVRIRCLVSLGPVFGAHFGEFGGWDFVGFSVDLERVLKEFDVGVTSA